MGVNSGMGVKSAGGSSTSKVFEAENSNRSDEKSVKRKIALKKEQQD